MFMELAFGQFASLGPIAIFERFCPLFHGMLLKAATHADTTRGGGLPLNGVTIGAGWVRRMGNGTNGGGRGRRKRIG